MMLSFANVCLGVKSMVVASKLAHVHEMTVHYQFRLRALPM